MKCYSESCVFRVNESPDPELCACSACPRRQTVKSSIRLRATTSGYRERAEKAEMKLMRYMASGLEPCDYAAMRSALDGEKQAKQSLSEALCALAESNARAEKAERERDAAVEQLRRCDNRCDYCRYRGECRMNNKYVCDAPSPSSGEFTDYWAWNGGTA